MARTHHEPEWIPVEVLWDERVADEPANYWDRPAARPAYQAPPESRDRRVRPPRDDAREPIERFGSRRKRDEPNRRKNKVRFDDFEDDDF
jgi:hypothetical protein